MFDEFSAKIYVWQSKAKSSRINYDEFKRCV